MKILNSDVQMKKAIYYVVTDIQGMTNDEIIAQLPKTKFGGSVYRKDEGNAIVTMHLRPWHTVKFKEIEVRGG